MGQEEEDMRSSAMTGSMVRGSVTMSMNATVSGSINVL